VIGSALFGIALFVLGIFNAYVAVKDAASKNYDYLYINIVCAIVGILFGSTMIIPLVFN
jgi:hypothetical protein